MSEQPKQPPLESMQLVAPINVRPGPSPSEFAVGRVETPGQTIIVLQMATRHGVQFYFFGPDAARELARQMEGAAGGIIVSAPPGLKR